MREPVRDKSVDVIEASFIVVSPMETELAETLLKITSLVVATACPILNVVAMVLLPSKPTLFGDNVTPVPCVKVKVLVVVTRKSVVAAATGADVDESTKPSRN